MKDAASLFRMLADGTRLRLLRVLAHERFNVSELTRIIAVAQSGISRHLSLLRDAGLVVEEREAGFVYYRLARDGDPNAIRFPRAMADSGDFDFSLSGLKTAVLRHVKAERQAERDVDPADLAASFQEAIVDVQVAKTIDAARERRVDTVLLGGGVVANTRLRERMEKAGAEAGFRVMFPSLDLCTDNGAMIAVAGTWRLLRGERTSLGVGADPSLELG